MLPAIANGVAVACTRLYVMQVLPDKRGLRLIRDEQGWYDEIDIANLSPKEAEMARAAQHSTTDACPPPRLQTVIAGMLL